MLAKEAAERKLEAVQKLQEDYDQRLEADRGKIKESADSALAKEKQTVSERLKAPVIALLLYNVLLTVFWAKDHSEAFQSVGTWFLNRWGNLKWLFGKFVMCHDFFYRITGIPKLWFSVVIYALLSICVLGIIFLAGFGIYMLWENELEYDWYRHMRDNKAVKVGISVALLFTSVPIAVWLTEVFSVLTIVSWWFISSLVLELIYHGSIAILQRK